MEAHTKAIELARYSIRACYNEKIFPMRSRRALANRIVDSVVLIHNNVYKANNTYVTDKDDAEYRLGLQEEAIYQDSRGGDGYYLGFYGDKMRNLLHKMYYGSTIYLDRKYEIYKQNTTIR